MAEHNRHKLDRAYAVLLAGGTGTRLWPISRTLYPKQLASFIGDDSLVQSTIKRVTSVFPAPNLRIVCGNEHYFEITRHMEKINIEPAGKILCEPCGRNTAPAILLAALSINALEERAVIAIFPADHVIADISQFNKRVSTALKLAEDGHIVTFGITPGYAETGYGYIEGANAVETQHGLPPALAIKRFIEKPNKSQAEEYLKAGNFFWNSGMFAFKASVILAEFKKLHPDTFEILEQIVTARKPLTTEVYQRLPNLSIDYAIMERTDKGVVLPSDFGWSDIGSWKSLYDFLPKDENNNVIDGDVIANNTTNCFIMGQKHLIAANRLKNMVIVGTPDAVLVSDLENSQEVKAIVDTLKVRGRQEYHQHYKRHYQWGTETLLKRNDNFCVYEKNIRPACKHTIDGEHGSIIHLVILSGRAKFSDGSRIQTLTAGQSEILLGDICADIENIGGQMLSVTMIQLYTFR
jgi:mannose-1-phosphate guanylyltransferase/mannose-6-phosphate isomerase